MGVPGDGWTRLQVWFLWVWSVAEEMCPTSLVWKDKLRIFFGSKRKCVQKCVCNGETVRVSSRENLLPAEALGRLNPNGSSNLAQLLAGCRFESPVRCSVLSENRSHISRKC